MKKVMRLVKDRYDSLVLFFLCWLYAIRIVYATNKANKEQPKEKRRVVRFMKEWYVGFLFWLYFGCLIYVASISRREESQTMAVLHNPVIVFLLVSMGGLLIWANFECGKALAEELPKEMRRISKELHRPKK